MAAAPLVLLSNMAARLGMVGCLTIEEVAANSQWLVPTICCTCNGNNPTIFVFKELNLDTKIERSF